MTMHSRLTTAMVTVFAVLCTATSIWYAPDVAAESGSSSRVLGRGDILTTIFGVSTSRNSRRPAGPPARCRTIRFTDADIEFVVAIIGNEIRTPRLQEFVDLFRDHLLIGPTDIVPAEEFDFYRRQCGNETVDIWTVPRASTEDIATRISRTMLTRLPDPVVVQTPPLAAYLPVNEPVFMSVAPSSWRPIDAVLDLDGTTAEVRATPVWLRVHSGEPDTGFRTCEGPGTKFDADSTRSARTQAGASGACTITYRAPSVMRSARRPAWVGAVSVIWRAEWRTDAGPWRSLGLIPRTRLFERDTVELGSAITRMPAAGMPATWITRSAAPSRAGAR